MGMGLVDEAVEAVETFFGGGAFGAGLADAPFAEGGGLVAGGVEEFFDGERLWCCRGSGRGRCAGR